MVSGLKTITISTSGSRQSMSGKEGTSGESHDFVVHLQSRVSDVVTCNARRMVVSRHDDQCAYSRIKDWQLAAVADTRYRACALRSVRLVAD